MQETWVPSLGRKDTRENEMAICSSVLSWRTPWTEEPVAYTPWVAMSQTGLSHWVCTCTLPWGLKAAPRARYLPMCARSVRQSCPTLRPHRLACEAAVSMGFSRPECWNGLPFPSNLRLLHWQAESLPVRHLGSHLAHSKSPFIGYYEYIFSFSRNESQHIRKWALSNDRPYKNDVCLGKGVERSQYMLYMSRLPIGVPEDRPSVLPPLCFISTCAECQG